MKIVHELVVFTENTKITDWLFSNKISDEEVRKKVEETYVFLKGKEFNFQWYSRYLEN